MSQSAARDRLKLELRRSAGPGLLYVLLVIAGLLVAADIISNLSGTKPWDSYTQYRVAFTDVKGVLPGSTTLRIAGVDVGTVTGAGLVDGRPVLTLSLQQQYAPMYTDASLRIRPVTALEDMYVDITSRGHKSAGVLRGNEILPATQTTSPTQISSVVDSFSADARARLATLLDQLGAGLSDGGVKLRASFEAIAPFLVVADRMSSALAQRHVELARLVHNFSGLSQELALRDTELSGFVRSANSTLAALANNNAPFAATIQQLPGTLASMSSAFTKLRTAEGSLDPALQSLGPVANALPSGLDALSRFSADATPALNALRPAVTQLRPLARVLEPTSRALAGSFTQLRPEAPQLGRITALAAHPACLTYIGQFLNRVISLTKFGHGQNNVATARANVTVDIASAGALVNSPFWKIPQICYDQSGTPTP
jgi:ABC-type transporter Mla subunit MlaD